MDGYADLGYWVEVWVNKVFKDRPTCSIAVLAFISGIVVVVMTLRAENPDEYVFPIFGLIFILIVFFVYGRRHFREDNDQDSGADDLNRTFLD